MRVYVILSSTPTLYEAGVKAKTEPDRKVIGPFKMVSHGCPAVAIWDTISFGPEGLSATIFTDGGMFTYEGLSYTDFSIELEA